MANEQNSPFKDLFKKINEPYLKRLEQAETRILDALKTVSIHQTQDEYITPDEVCKRLKISRTTLWNYENKGYISSKGIGGRRYYFWNEVVDALQTKNS